VSDDIVSRFFDAIEAGDIETVRAIYAPRAVIWHNDDLVEQSVPDNLKVLQVRDGHITRIEEYLDSAKRSSIRAAREALSP
jgi:ketosteroid isomerase-like protein